MDFSLTVLQRDSTNTLVPSAGTPVRLDGKNWTLELETNAAGRAEVRLDRSRAPWDVTAARAGYVPISILDLSEPVDAPIELEHLDYSADALGRVVVEVSGTVAGKSSPSTFVRVNATPAGSEGQYEVGVMIKREAASVRVLATEHAGDPWDSPVLNAVWVDASWSGQDLRADIVFPTPARTTVKTQRRLDLPTTGPVTGSGLAPWSGYVTRSLDQSRLTVPVGHTWLEPDAAGNNAYTWFVDALEGDMQPSLVSMWFTNTPLTHAIFAHVSPSSQGPVVVPPAEVLDAFGTSIDVVSLSWSAPAHSSFGAQIARVDSAAGTEGRWYAYSRVATPARGRAWPRLPSSVSLADVRLAGAESLLLDVFAESSSDGIAPWTWSKESHSRGVLRRFNVAGFK